MRRTKSDVNVTPGSLHGRPVLNNSFLFFADINISIFVLFIVVFLRVMESRRENCKGPRTIMLSVDVGSTRDLISQK